MKTDPLATVAIMVVASATTASAEKVYNTAKHRNAFMRAMRSSHESRGTFKDQTPSLKTFAQEMSGGSKRARKLRKKVMQKAKLLETRDEGRRLDYNQANNAAYKTNYNNAYGSSSNQKDGADDYFAAFGEWSNNFGFDPTQYSVSYHRCAEVRQYDDYIAQREDTTSVFATKHFAVFRFCPSLTCEGVLPNQDEEEWQRQQEEYEAAVAAQNGNGEQQQAEKTYQSYEQYMQETVFDRLKVGGANGEGCQSNYGEYMLELSDYLEMMADYHEERFEMYCETCEECMYDIYQAWLKNGGNGRKLKDRSDPSWRDDLESEEFEEATHRQLYNKYAICPEYDTCRYYQQSCKQGVDDSLTQYFECTEVQKNNGKVAYIGPHCSSDGITITLGVFADEDCNEYIGNSVNIANFLGFELEEDALANYVTGSLADVIPEEGIQAQNARYSQNYDAELAEYYTPIDHMCIPCKASRQPYEVRGNVGDYQDQGGNDDGGDDDINELCENLYMVSARCDKHFRNYALKTKQAKYAEAVAQEELSCGFIQSVVMGNYNELGFVNIDNMEGYSMEAKTGFLKDSILWEQYGHNIQEVTPLQIFGLVATISMCAILAVWAGTLRQSLFKGGRPWRPRSYNSNKAGGVVRTNSGIVMGRSQSNLFGSPSELSERNHSYYMT